MGTKEVDGLPPPEDLELWDDRDPKTLYTDALLRERLARGRQPTCGLFGCTKYRYAGWGNNPYHCCPVHRELIQQAQRFHGWNLMHTLRRLGCPDEATLFQSGRKPTKQWVECPDCRQRFRVNKTQLTRKGNRLVCPRCHPEAYAEVVCRRCSQTFLRLRWRVVQDRRPNRAYQSAFCSACWENHCGDCVRLLRPSYPPVILTCTRCHKEFPRSWKEVRAAQCQGYTSTFCSPCWHHHRSECLKLNRQGGVS